MKAKDKITSGARGVRRALSGSGLRSLGGFIAEDQFAVWPTKASGQTWGLMGSYLADKGVWSVARADTATGVAVGPSHRSVSLREAVALARRGY